MSGNFVQVCIYILDEGHFSIPDAYVIQEQPGLL
jgi:hypothetical protein